jgi:hypothetical protein
MNLDGLDRRLSRLEEKRSSSRLEWRTQSGRKVSFSIVPEMLAAKFELLEAQAAALCRKPLPPFGDALTALLSTPEEELLRLSETLSWVATVPAQWDFVQNPPLDDDEEGFSGGGTVVEGMFP